MCACTETTTDNQKFSSGENDKDRTQPLNVQSSVSISCRTIKTWMSSIGFVSCLFINVFAFVEAMDVGSVCCLISFFLLIFGLFVKIKTSNESRQRCSQPSTINYRRNTAHSFSKSHTSFDNSSENEKEESSNCSKPAHRYEVICSTLFCCFQQNFCDPQSFKKMRNVKKLD